MFRLLASRGLASSNSALPAIARRHFATRSLPKRYDAVPAKGLAQGGHPNVLQQEGNVVKTWLYQPAAYPIMVITAGALLFASYKVFFVDAASPDTHWWRSERGTLDYIENDRDPARAQRWANGRFHTGLLK